MEALVEVMSELIAFHRDLGKQKAYLNWFDCYDIDHTSNQYQSNKAHILQIERKILQVRNQLKVCLEVKDFDTLIAECLSETEICQETMEQEIEKQYRPPGVVYKENALVILTEEHIPEDIRIALSFGYKFLFPFECNNKNIHEILAQLEMTIEQAVPELKQREAATLIQEILRKRDSFQVNGTVRWLKFISARTSLFFKNNPHLFATKSDKGAHTVVVEVAVYEEKLASLLNDNNYVELDQDPLLDLIGKDKAVYTIFSKSKNRLTQAILKEIGCKYEPNTLRLAKFYGLFKIHKQGVPLRPITSTIGSPGYLLAKMFTQMLELVFPRTPYHIVDSYNFVTFLDDITIKDEDVLVSFDVVSMYTSIPFELVKEIIMEKAGKFYEYFGIGKILLLKLIEHLLIDCMVFTALDKTYKQTDGLPMGSCASPVLARMVMDRVVEYLMLKVPTITFIRVFVDDTVAAIDRNLVGYALRVLNNFRPNQIKFTCEKENEHASITFLNTTLKRENKKIIYRWHRKYFYSGRILNFFSSHKRTTVLATATHFIQTVLRLSDASYFRENLPIVRATLLDNNFPETLVLSLINEFYTLMKPLSRKSKNNSDKPPKSPSERINYLMRKHNEEKKVEEQKERFVIFPHSICKGRDIKKVLHELRGPMVTLADSVRNTRVNSITTRKTITSIEKRKNLILSTRCVCKKRVKVVKSSFNETGEMAEKKLVTKKIVCDTHSHAYRKVKFHRGLFYDGQTKYLLRYVQWKHRERLDVAQCRYQWPTFLREFGKFL